MENREDMPGEEDMEDDILGLAEDRELGGLFDDEDVVAAIGADDAHVIDDGACRARSGEPACDCFEVSADRFGKYAPNHSIVPRLFAGSPLTRR